MSPKKEIDQTAPAAAEANPDEKIVAPPYLRFLGRADVFVSGVPQADLEVVTAPAQPGQVNPKMAIELLKSGLYVGSEEPPARPAADEEVAPNG